MESQLLSSKYIRQQPRWDFRYFDPKYLEVEKLLDTCHYPVEPLANHVKQIVNFGAYSLCNLLVWVDNGIPYLRVTDMKEDGIVWSNVPHIPSEIHDQLPKSKVYPGDVLYSMAGTIGLAVVAPEDLGDCNSNQAIAKIRLKESLNPWYLATFLNSKLGRYQSERIANGQTVLNINMGEIGLLRISLPPRPMQEQIAQVMQDAYATRQAKLAEAKSLLGGIDKYVLGRLGINIGELQSRRIAVVPISSIAGGRFDFEAVVTVPELNFNSTEPTLLGQIVKQINDRTTPANDSPDEEVNYISLGNIASNTGELVEFTPVKGSSVLSSSPKFKRGDILFGRMRPYLNKVWVAEFDGICSGEALVFRPNQGKVDTYFLHALLLSRVTLHQVVPLQSGTSLPRVSAADVLSIKLPIPKDLKQQAAIGQEVAHYRSQAKRLRAEAEAVIAKAKARVERLILGEEASN